MKKQCISLSILFALTLSTVQPLAAVNFKAWAQSYMKKFSPRQIKEKAIAATQKLKGLKAKDAWNKINFMGRASREFRAAREALNVCESKHCAVQQNAARDAFKAMKECQRSGGYACGSLGEKSQNANAAVRRCHQAACPAEHKAFKQADTKLDKSTFALMGIIVTAYSSVIGIGAGTAIYLGKKDQQSTLLGDEPESIPPSYEKAVEMIESERGQWQINPLANQ